MKRLRLNRSFAATSRSTSAARPATTTCATGKPRADDPPRVPWRCRRSRPRRHLRAACRDCRAGSGADCRQLRAHALPEHVRNRGDIDRDRRGRVRPAEVPAPRGRVEREPAVAVEPDLDPGVRVPIVDAPRPAVRVVGAAREAGGDPRGNPEVAEHEGHRAGEVLAVAALRAGHEPDERRHPGLLRWMLVVGEPSARPQPGLDRDGRRVRVRGRRRCLRPPGRAADRARSCGLSNAWRSQSRRFWVPNGGTDRPTPTSRYPSSRISPG